MRQAEVITSKQNAHLDHATQSVPVQPGTTRAALPKREAPAPHERAMSLHANDLHPHAESVVAQSFSLLPIRPKRAPEYVPGTGVVP